MPKKTFEALEEENRTLRDGFQELRDLVVDENPLSRAEGLAGFARYAWGRPEFRLMVLVGWIYFAMWWNAGGDVSPHVYKQHLPILATGLVFFGWKWAQLEYRTFGFIQLLMKGGLYFAGHYIAKASFCSEADLPWVGAQMLFFALLAISRLTQNIAAKVVDLANRVSETPAGAFFKDWLL